MPRNPYEKDEELDIPDFVEDNTRNDTSTSINYSIFKMSDDELYEDEDDSQTDYDDEDYERPRRKRKANVPLIICMIIIFFLLILSIASIFYALKQHESYVKANTAYLQLQADEETYKTQLAQKDQQIDALNQEIEQLKSSGASGEGSLVYQITDGPVTFRKRPSKSADKTTYNNEESAYNNDKFNVIEIVKGEDDSDYSWAKIKDDVYFCIGTADEPWAKKIN